MKEWQVRAFDVYGLGGYLMNLMLHLFEGLEMWTFEYSVTVLLPLAIIGDILVCWLRILEFMSEFHGAIFTLMVIIILPLIFAVGTLLFEILSGIASTVQGGK